VELFQGFTFGLFYATMASYASIVAPPGTEATMQGTVGAVFEGIGKYVCDNYTGCPGRNVPDFRRMFLKLKYTDITQNTCIQS